MHPKTSCPSASGALGDPLICPVPPFVLGERMFCHVQTARGSTGDLLSHPLQLWGSARDVRAHVGFSAPRSSGPFGVCMGGLESREQNTELRVKCMAAELWSGTVWVAQCGHGQTAPPANIRLWGLAAFAVCADGTAWASLCWAEG